MIAPHVIQADIIADIKAQTSITDLLFSADEVREDEYQGTVYRYPTIRLAIISQTPLLGPEPCDLADLQFAIRVYTEESSSRSTSVILGAVNDVYHRKIFDGTTWISWMQSSGLINPARQGPKLWRGEALFAGTIYPKSGAL
jgi:hypothetical protein